MADNKLAWLMEWYSRQCDGDWEHGNGIDIGTIDNPGWFLKVDLKDTELENKEFKNIKIDRSENNWFFCCVRDKKYEGHGGPLNLSELLQIFEEWSKS